MLRIISYPPCRIIMPRKRPRQLSQFLVGTISLIARPGPSPSTGISNNARTWRLTVKLLTESFGSGASDSLSVLDHVEAGRTKSNLQASLSPNILVFTPMMTYISFILILNLKTWRIRQMVKSSTWDPLDMTAGYVLLIVSRPYRFLMPGNVAQTLQTTPGIGQKELLWKKKRILNLVQCKKKHF